MQEFDVTVVYKSGRKYSDADSLSRTPVDPPPDVDQDDDSFVGPISTDDFAERQRADAELKDLMDHLKGKTAAVPKVFRRGLASFFLHNNVLLKKNLSPLRADYLLVVPSALRPEVLESLHDDPTAGHVGFSRSLSRIQEKYYWPRLTADVDRYVDMQRLSATQDTGK